MRRGSIALLVVLAPLALLATALLANHLWGPAPRAQAYVVRIELPPAGGELGLPPVEGPLDASRPLVVIDAGHGGHDPGAGAKDPKEKALTLGLARALHDELLSAGGIRVAMTRADDRYLALEERFGIARRLKADLFIAIHADSAGGANAAAAHGATIYTLSQRGSTDEANRIASSENAADSVNGVPIKASASDVSAILVDLSQRQSAQQSAEFAQLILREGAGKLAFRDRPVESAAFVVLKSPDVPSVLVEAGYISNPGDAARLASAAGRKSFAEVLARSIRVFFARQLAASGAAAAR